MAGTVESINSRESEMCATSEKSFIRYGSNAIAKQNEAQKMGMPELERKPSQQQHHQAPPANLTPVFIGNRRQRNGLKCPMCNKMFSNSSAIAKHKLTHSDERKYVCSTCKKAFKRQDHLNGHKLTHATKKPHGCHFCDKSYSDARSLRRHYESAHPDLYEQWRLLSNLAEVTYQGLEFPACTPSSTGADDESAGLGAGAFDGAECSRDAPAHSQGSWPSGSASGDHSHRASPLGSAASLPYQLSQSEVQKLLKSMPLEEPKRVACSVCKRRFKNQSALNGHMRLHGGYGPPAGGEGSGADTASLRGTSSGSGDQVSPPLSKLKMQDVNIAEVVASSAAAAAAVGTFDWMEAVGAFSREPNSSSTLAPSSTTVAAAAAAAAALQSLTGVGNSSKQLPSRRASSPPRGGGNLHSVRSLGLSPSPDEGPQHQQALAPSPPQPSVSAWMQQQQQHSSESGTGGLLDSSGAFAASRLTAEGEKRQQHALPSSFSLSSVVASTPSHEPRYSSPLEYPFASITQTAASSDINSIVTPGDFRRGTSRASSAQQHALGIAAADSQMDFVFRGPWKRSFLSALEQQQQQQTCRPSSSPYYTPPSSSTSTHHLKHTPQPQLQQHLDSRRSFSLVPPSSMDFDALTGHLSRSPLEQQTFSSGGGGGGGMMHPNTLGLMLHDAGGSGGGLNEVEAHRRRLLLCRQQQQQEDSSQFSFAPATAKASSAFDLSFGGRGGGRFGPAPPALICAGGGPLSKPSQPHYSPITPVPGSASFGNVAGAMGSTSTGADGGHFTFPPSEALLVSTDASSKQQQSFVGAATGGGGGGAAASPTSSAFCSQQQQHSPPGGGHLGASFSLFHPQQQPQRRHSSTQLPPPPLSLPQKYANPVADSSSNILHAAAASALQSASSASSGLQQRFHHHHQQSISLAAPGMSVKLTPNESAMEAAQQTTGLAPDCYDAKTSTSSVFGVRTEAASGEVAAAAAVEYSDKWPPSQPFSAALPSSQDSSTVVRRWSSPQTTSFHPHHRPSLQHALPLRCNTPLSEMDSDLQRTSAAHFGQLKPQHSGCISLTHSEQPQASVRPTCSTPEFLQTTQRPHSMLNVCEGQLGQKPLTTGKLEDQVQQMSPIARHYTIDSPRSVCMDHFAPAVPSDDPFLPPARALPYLRTFSQAPRSTPAIPSRNLDSSKSCFFFPDDGDDDLMANEQRSSALSHTQQPTAMDFCPSDLNFIQSNDMVESLPPQQEFGCDSMVKLEAVPLGKYQEPGSCETQNQQQQQRPVEDVIPLSSSNSASFGNEGVVSPAPAPVFRNPQAPPPTSKKYKRKPDPIAIPTQQTWMNSSRLRSPRLFNPTEPGAVSSTPPPYTPPPMLSPNRRGPGLFSSVSRSGLRRQHSSLPQHHHQHPALQAPPGSGGGMLRRVSCAAALKHLPAGDHELEADGLLAPLPRSDRAIAPKSAPFAYKAVNFFSDFDFPGLDECKSPMSLKMGSTLPEHSDVTAFFDSSAADSHEVAANEVPVGGGGVAGANEPAFFHYTDEEEATTAAATATTTTTTTGGGGGGGEPGGRLFDFVDSFGGPSSNSNPSDALNASAHLSSESDDQHVNRALDAFLPPPLPPPSAAKTVFDLPHDEEEEEEDDEEEEEHEEEEEEEYDHWGATPRTEEMRSLSAASVLSPRSHTVDMDQLEEDVDEGFPSSSEPTINVGPAYQAELPDFTDEPDPTRRGDSRTWEVLLWDPKNFNDGDAKSQEALSRLMTIACSPAVRTCGLNMEYTFHLLCKFKGNMEQSLRALLQESFIVLDNVYAETTPWCTEEIGCFQYALRRHEKDFHRVSKELQACGMDKSVKACVEFYYVWKRMNTRREVNRFRGRHSRGRTVTRQEVELQQQQQQTGAPPPGTDGRQQFFDLSDPPVLSASGGGGGYDLDTAAPASHDLAVNGNGGGGGTTYNLRKKPPKCDAGDDFYNSSLVDFMNYQGPPDSRHFEDASAHFTADVEEGEDEERQAFDRRFGLPTTTTTTTATATVVPASRDSNPGQSAAASGEQGFACRLCGRCFSKVKSRNAHMKSHSDRARAAV